MGKIISTILKEVRVSNYVPLNFAVYYIKTFKENLFHLLKSVCSLRHLKLYFIMFALFFIIYRIQMTFPFQKPKKSNNLSLCL